MKKGFYTTLTFVLIAYLFELQFDTSNISPHHKWKDETQWEAT